MAAAVKVTFLWTTARPDATSTHQSVSAPWTNGVAMPFVWKKVHGKGRVFYSASGHVCSEFTSFPSQLEITLRGMVWAAR